MCHFASIQKEMLDCIVCLPGLLQYERRLDEVALVAVCDT
jgi:hypothetical protein